MTRHLHRHLCESASWAFLASAFGPARAAAFLRAWEAFDAPPRWVSGVRVRGRG